jgi:hypothetical protein
MRPGGDARTRVLEHAALVRPELPSPPLAERDTASWDGFRCVGRIEPAAPANSHAVQNTQKRSDAEDRNDGWRWKGR